jgi:endonuclease YncB( thermonuclease family)
LRGAQADLNGMFRYCSTLVLIALAGMASADLTGSPRVIDGDTVAIGDMRIRLHGIDAPERQQKCGGQNSPMWDCGAWVTAEVRARYDGRQAACTALEVDRYDRIIARCRVNGVDIGAALVEGGLAFAYLHYSEAYLPEQQAAERRRAGLHATGAQSPADFRRAKRDGYAAQYMASAPQDCTIKGNISYNSGARIYHMPGQSHYAKTKISLTKGEQWFCSEAEAQAAGWRRARN